MSDPRVQASPSARVLAIAELLDLLIQKEVEEIRQQHEGTDSERLRIMYRRGYHAGHAAGRRGTPEITNPERCARGELRGLLAVSESTDD